MIKNTIVSATAADRLYWLGRYEERVFMTLHILRKCYDLMIDGKPSEYKSFLEKLNSSEKYSTKKDFILGMMFDENNYSSVIYAQLRAMDNAMLQRDTISTETLSYLEMSIALLRKCKADRISNITELQRVSDWSLAFWGSAEQRIENSSVLMLMQAGRDVENIDMLVRFDYSHDKIRIAWDKLKFIMENIQIDILDKYIADKLETLIKEQWDNDDISKKEEILNSLSILIRV